MTSRSSPNPDHSHPDAWNKEDHYRFEARVSAELEKLEKAVDHLTTRVTLLLGGIGFLAFVSTILAPFVRAWLNIDVPSGQ